MPPPKEYPCPSCRVARRLRGARAFATTTCEHCGTQWRPRAEVGGYQLGEILARSAFGLIFQADGEAVAVKVLALPYGCRTEDLTKFAAAVQTLAANEHPNWVRVFGGGAEEDFAWLSMEWLTEGTLAGLGRIEEMAALQAAEQIAEAMRAAHEVGLDHRHLNIDECLLGDASTVKVSGFAESVFYERAGVSVGTVWGRLACAPPERLDDEPEDARSEIYALGAILFQLLTGEPPYESEVMPELMIERLEGPLPDASAFVPTLRKTTVQLVERMLARRPAERFASWEETAAAIRVAFDSLNESTTPHAARRVVPVRSATSPVKAPVYSAKSGAWMTILMLLGLGGILGWFVWDRYSQEEKSDAVVVATPLPMKPEPPPAPVSVPAPISPPTAATAPTAVAKVEPAAPPPAPVPPPADPAPPKPAPPAPPGFDWSGWKKFILESPKRPGTVKGDYHSIRGSGGLRLTGNNSGMAGSSDENVFYARPIEGNWTLTVRVNGVGAAAGLCARESLGSDRPAVGVFLRADGKLFGALRATPAAELKPQPVPAGDGAKWLRLVRRDDAMSAYFSLDGKQWREAVTLNLPTLPKIVPAGLVVWSDKKEPTGATFDEVSLAIGE